MSGKRREGGRQRTEETAGRDMRMRQHGLICFIENHFIMKMHINEINVCLMLSQLVCQLPQAIL